MTTVLTLPSHLITLDAHNFKPRILPDVVNWLNQHGIAGWKFDYELEWSHNSESNNILIIRGLLRFDQVADAMVFQMTWL